MRRMRKDMAGMSRESAIDCNDPGFLGADIRKKWKIYGLLDILRIPEIQTKALQWKKMFISSWNLMRKKILKIVENTGN